MQTTTLEPGNRQQIGAAVREAADVLRRGGLVAFPTETVYGLSAWASHAQAVAKLRRFKRNADRGFALHLPNPAAAWRYLAPPPARVRRIVERLLGHPVTLRITLDAGLAVAEGVLTDSTEKAATGLPDTLSLRCPDHAFARQLLEELDLPVVAGSASQPGQPAPTDARRAAAVAQDVADFLLDGGPCRFAKPSTAVSLSIRNGSPVVRVESEGVLDTRTIEHLSRFNILMVCTGNTCRSPMAEALAKHALADRLGIAVDELPTAGLSVSSAGVYAGPGEEASPEAVEALRLSGVTLAHHRSTPLTRTMIDEADLILGMTQSHVRAVVEMSPSAADRTARLDPKADIADPIGQSLAAYQSTAEQISRAVSTRLQEQLS